MRQRWRSMTCLAAAAMLALAVAPPGRAVAAEPATCNGAPAPWMEPTRPAPERADLAIGQMTLDEKISMLGSVRDATHFRETLPIARLCLPGLRMNNGSAGVSTGGPTQFPATALPSPIGLAATWDPKLAERYGYVGGRETRDQGRDLLEGPAVDLARVPVNGRTFEGYGEDPRLASEITVGTVKGIQSQDVIANVKHYAANNQETDRNSINEIIDERTLREIYLPAYEAGVKRGRSGSVMCAKNKVNGEFSCHHKTLLTDVLRGEWKFPGFVVSDFDSCHNTPDCINNETEFELPQSKYFSVAALTAAVNAGQVTVATIDEAVRRIFTTMIRFGVFDRPRT